MIRFMLDSDKPAAIPPGVAQVVATYADLFQTMPELAAFQRRHEGSVVVLIDRGLGDPMNRASIADVEPGALTPEQLPGWFAAKTAAEVGYLTVYSDRDELDPIQAALAGTGHEDHWRWIATLDGTVVIEGYQALERPAAVQCLTAAMLGVPCDGSLVLNPGWNPS